MYSSSQCPSRSHFAATSLSPPPGLEASAYADLGAASLQALSVDMPDLFFGARPGETLGAPVKIIRSAEGGLVLQHHLWQKQAAHCEDADSHSTCTPPPEPISSSPEDQQTQKGKKSRFCKAKRDRYRKLVERLVEQVRKNPLTFDLDSADLPASMMVDPKSKAKLLATVMKFAQV